MATKTITEISALKKYLNEMLHGTGRPGDTYPRIKHAPQLDIETVIAVAGNLVMRADDGTIEVGTRTQKNGIVHEVNRFWFTVHGRPYAIVYHNKQIEIRARGLQGNKLHAINKITSPAQIAGIFAAL